jgi:hypothetical protein
MLIKKESKKGTWKILGEISCSFYKLGWLLGKIYKDNNSTDQEFSTSALLMFEFG